MRCIGSTTYTEYRGIFEKTMRWPAFQKIDVPEPSIEETVAILQRPEDPLRRASRDHLRRTRLSRRPSCQRNTSMTVICRTRPSTSLMRRAPTCGYTVDDREERVTVRIIENIVAKMARIPPRSVSASDKDVMRTLERDLKLVIFRPGQGDLCARSPSRCRGPG